MSVSRTIKITDFNIDFKSENGEVNVIIPPHYDLFKENHHIDFFIEREKFKIIFDFENIILNLNLIKGRILEYKANDGKGIFNLIRTKNDMRKTILKLSQELHFEILSFKNRYINYRFIYSSYIAYLKGLHQNGLIDSYPSYLGYTEENQFSNFSSDSFLNDFNKLLKKYNLKDDDIRVPYFSAND